MHRENGTRTFDNSLQGSPLGSMWWRLLSALIEALKLQFTMRNGPGSGNLEASTGITESTTLGNHGFITRSRSHNFKKGGNRRAVNVKSSDRSSRPLAIVETSFMLYMHLNGLR